MVLLVLICTQVFLGCKRRDVRLTTRAQKERKEMPALLAYDVNTLISDSGVVRYRIKAATWQVFDKADTPYWEFPEGIYLEKFNENLTSDASIEADYAFYNEPAQLWTLRGNVKAINLEGEQFETPLMFWDQKSETVYSDSSIVITRDMSVIKGMGFRSNQSMTEYTILRPTGVFPIEE
jgi:LPS export ABC transporter protein LptC